MRYAICNIRLPYCVTSSSPQPNESPPACDIVITCCKLTFGCSSKSTDFVICLRSAPLIHKPVSTMALLKFLR